MRRLVVIAACAVACPVTAADAWTWPVDGPVLRPFSFDPAQPYAAGQHRGVDIGTVEGAAVVAPVEGTVTFAGTVPNGGRTVSITTAGGYTATLLHLGSIAVKRGAAVEEGMSVGAAGSNGSEQPYVYFGVRVTAEPQGYLDPLSLLPPRSAPSVPSGGSVAPPATDEAPAPAAQPAPAPAPATPPAAQTPSAAPASPPNDASSPVAVGSEVAAQIPTASRDVTDQTAAGRRTSSATSSATRSRITRPAARVSSVRPQESGAARPSESARVVRGTEASRASRAVLVRPRPDWRRSPRATHDTSSRTTPLAALTGVGLVALALLVGLLARRRGARTAARIMSIPRARAPVQEDPCRTRVAVCERAAASGPRSGVRRAGGHLRAVPPVEGERRPDGERYGRARDARDGLRRSRGRLAA